MEAIILILLGMPLFWLHSKKYSKAIYLNYGLLIFIFYIYKKDELILNIYKVNLVYFIFFYIAFSLIPVVLFIISLFKKEKISEDEKEIKKYNFELEDTNKSKVKINNPFRGIIVVGGAGSGKSKTFFYPIIKQLAEKNYSGVMYDFKSPELSNLTEHYYKNLSTEISIQKIDFKDIKTSSRVNPLSYINSSVEATNYAQALIFNLLPEYIEKQDFWSRSILSLFSGAIWYFRKNNPEYATLPHIIAFFISANANTIIKVLAKDREIKGNLSALVEAVEQGAEKQVAGVLGTLKNTIGIFNNPQIFWLLSKDEVNLNVNDPKNPTMLLVGNDSKLSDTYAPLISLIITICSKLMNEPNKCKSVIMIDEAPTIYLPNFEQIPATARSNKLSVIVGTQDLSQMVDKYGQEKANVLISNLGNQFFGRTTNKETADRVVQMFGQREDVEVLEGSSGSGLMGAVGMHTGRSKSQTIVKRDRVKIQQILNFSPGQFVGLIAEGNKKEFNGILKEGENPVILPVEKTEISNQELNNNFDKIYTEIEELLNENKNDFGFK